ncbi:MAG: BlaI/MecI/CopY family transcriptional regulator [Opitutales bacterium]|jgi:BlaI family transcriptional regulator, penicillinase repressor|nr:BlaI/MecI/CopY family transcriptional regulator [Opitutales bacterium]MDP4644436.1 BlaI/MecI/CopY family transcriptional regulator [Opitutales bacterium]MDP4777310.1 BlaI/MecI/CopY family transcriptional regulator [Opitutales bacterium]MDP4883533.1 BlaI/MecI/CopY family transcriptional regulator [Opitutales bacterium]
MEEKLTKRESELMDVIYKLGEASAADVETQLPNAPSNAAIRTLLGILVDKGHLKFEKRGRRFIYKPTVARQKAGRSALSDAVTTFFDGSLSQAVAGLLSGKSDKISIHELNELEQLIADAKRREEGNK